VTTRDARDMQGLRDTGTPRTVAYVIFGLACGGAEMVLLELVRGLDRSRYRPVVISLAPPAELSRAFEDSGVELHHLGLRRIHQAPLIFAKALRLVRRLRPDLLHGVLFYGDFTARLLAMLGAAPRVVSAIHSTVVGPRWHAELLRITDRFADSVTAVSDAVARARLEAGTVSADKLTVIPNGIDLARFARPTEVELGALRERFGLAAGDRVMLSVGRLEPEKNHEMLLRVFARVRARFPDALLLIVGSGGLQAALERRAIELAIESRVRLVGHVSPVAPIYHLAELFVLASRFEGLPMVVLEAMAAGLPMVLTSVGGIPEVVEDGRTGWLVPAGDEAQLEAALVRALGAPAAEREAIARAAASDVRARFGMERMVSSTEQLYDALLADAPRVAG
jgi:glycosyltransferase involved in cell wall biosynthesis